MTQIEQIDRSLLDAIYECGGCDGSMAGVEQAYKLIASYRQSVLEARPAGDYVMVRAAALDWLFGEGPDDDGLYFGDEEAPRVKGAFWWRPKFRTMIAARPAVGEDVVERVDFHEKLDTYLIEAGLHHRVTLDDALGIVRAAIAAITGESA